ncbi:hypothetical protein Asp14428_17390 [Actinoplanes sp. NBRC 14428]|nr:hypothetical protein Asp14428_17390 [Actinoplanes sp. NBRC 14428]
MPSVLIRMMDAGLLDAGPGSLRCCVFAGEPFPPAAVKRLRAAWPGVRMFNWYGPTETNVCTSYEVTAADLHRTGPCRSAPRAAATRSSWPPTGRSWCPAPP